MPKKLDYPKTTMKKALALAKSIDDLGDSCQVESAAEKMGMAVSGGFWNIVSAAGKFGFIYRKKGVLSVGKNYKNIKLAYDEGEKLEIMQKAFLNIPLYEDIYKKFNDKKLPVDMLDKVLQREFEVKESHASRVSGYFVKGAKEVKLLNEDHTFNKLKKDKKITTPDSNNEKDEENFQVPNSEIKDFDTNSSVDIDNENKYVFNIKTPSGMHTIVVKDEFDMLMLETIIKKIKKEKGFGSKDDETD